MKRILVLETIRYMYEVPNNAPLESDLAFQIFLKQEKIKALSSETDWEIIDEIYVPDIPEYIPEDDPDNISDGEKI